MVLFQSCVLLFVHTLAYGFSSPSCDELEEKVAEADQLTEITSPPPLSGRWVSEKCEVREGPEYILRSYMYSENETFILSTHRYQDESCAKAGITYILRGRYSLRGKSWTTPGATQCDYILERVELIVHHQQAADEWLLKLNATCPDALARVKKLRAMNEYLLYNHHAAVEGTAQPQPAKPVPHQDDGYLLDLACLRALDMALPDVGLVRVQKRPPGPPDPRAPRVELFLGETRQRGTSFHTPLLKVTQSVDCEVCLALERAPPKVPPSLPFVPRLPPVMSGEWVSTRCETRPMGLFLRRRLKVSGRSWDAEFRFFSDPKCTAATLVAAAQGHYSTAKVPADRVPGASDFDFMVDKGFLTLHDKGLVQSLQKDKKCGPPGIWQVGVKRDLTPSKGCPPLGIVIPTTEYELVRVEVDAAGNTLLYLGHSDTAKKGEPKKRPTAFQPPLLQCNAPELPPLTHFLNSYNSATTAARSLRLAAISAVIVILSSL